KPSVHSFLLGMPMQFHRRGFLKGVGAAVLVACASKLSFAHNVQNFTEVLHVNGVGDQGWSPSAAAGLRLTALDTGQDEFWQVSGDALVRVMPGNGMTAERKGSAQRYVIRNIGGCRTAILGVSLSGGGREWLDRIDKLAESSAALKRTE